MRCYSSKRKITIASAAFLVLILFIQHAQADLYTGVISGWEDPGTPGPHVTIGDGTNRVSFWWSINTINHGWFYRGSTQEAPNNKIAFATGVTDISQIADASTFNFDNYVIGPCADAEGDPDGVGDFMIVKNTDTNYYGVIRVDDIYPEQLPFFPPNPKLDATWWFQSDGTANFNDSIVPAPGAVLLGILGLSAVGVKLRKHA